MTERPTTDERRTSKTIDEIIKEAKRIEEDGLISSKSHFNAASSWTNLHLVLGVPAVLLSTIAGITAFAQFEYHSLVAGILAIIVAILTGIITFLRPKEKANSHLTAGNNYSLLESKVRLFWTVECRIEDSEEILTRKIHDFVAQKYALNRDSPQPSKRAYRKAKKGVAEGEASHKVDESD